MEQGVGGGVSEEGGGGERDENESVVWINTTSSKE